MKIIFHREGFLSACQLVNVAVASRNVNPVLQNIKVVADDNRCTLIATDTEVGIRMDVRSVTVEEPGSALLQADKTLSILRESGDEELTIVADESGVTITGKRAEYELPSEDASIFPDFPEFSSDGSSEVDAAILRELVKRTIFAVANPEKTTKWGATSGVLWEAEGTSIRLVATDGRRLAYSDGTASAREGTTTTVVPIKAMTLLTKNVQEDGKVQVSFRTNEIMFKTERSTIYSRLVEGRFPNYKQAMPKSPTVKVPLVGGPILQAVKQAAIMTSAESSGVILAFSKGKLTLRARGVDTGSSKVETEIEYDAKPMEISFDPKYLIDMLKVFDSEAKFTLDLIDSNSPAVFRNEAVDFAYVVLPLVVRGKEEK